jgi:hypothetical protein
MFPQNHIKITNILKISNKSNNKEKVENNYSRRISKILLSFFLLLIIISEILNLKSKINFTKNKSENPIVINNNDSTLKNQIFTRLNNIFNAYKNEIELSKEYKNKFKQYLLNGFSSLFKKTYKKIEIIIFIKKMNFGNAIFYINNLIYFCEILGCKKIYLNKDYWFIKKPIYDKELNITISPLNTDIWDNQTSVYIESKSNK